MGRLASVPIVDTSIATDVSRTTTKHLRRYTRTHFDRVITVCDEAREVCPEFPTHPQVAHWSIADPALEGDTDDASNPAFERTAQELESRIELLLAELAVSNEEASCTTRPAT